MTGTPAQAAAELLEVAPSITRAIREQMRAHRAAELSVAQFRVLAYINRHAGASLSEVADHIGLALPSMSKLVDALVARKLVGRAFDTMDRRRVTLTLTPRGRSILDKARRATRAFLTAQLAECSRAELETLVAAMDILRPLFASPREQARVTQRKRNGNS